VAAEGAGALVGALVIASRRQLGAAVLVAPALLVGLAGLRAFPACLVLMVVIGAAESGFAAMQTRLVLLSAPERLRGGAMGILSACIGTQPLGTLAIGLLAAVLGAPAFTVNAVGRCSSSGRWRCRWYAAVLTEPRLAGWWRVPYARLADRLPGFRPLLTRRAQARNSPRGPVRARRLSPAGRAAAPLER
jgi:hypothetical protein